MEIIFWIQFSLLTVFSLVVLTNFFSAPILSTSKFYVDSENLVSVMIPARNEENNIANCLESITNQDYQNLEILVLDDESNDKTTEIVQSLEKINPRVKLIKGKPLPQDWLGKNWACHQLSEIANGKYFLFVDADVTLSASVVSASVAFLQKLDAKAFSVFPTQRIKSFGETLITPLMNWILLVFLPLRLVHSTRNESFVAANGQFIFFEADLYHKIGGHEKVKSEIVEDMALAKLVKQLNEKFVTALGGNKVFCRMYSNLSEGMRGFSKNFYKGFSISPIAFLLFLFFMEFVFLLPIIFSFFNFKFLYITLFIALLQLMVLQISRQNSVIAFLHPLQMVVLCFVGIKSLLASLNGNLTWKERKIH